MVIDRCENCEAKYMKVQGPDGEQMRLAMNSLLDRAGVVYEGLMGDEDDGEIKVAGITIHKSGKRDKEYEDGSEF